MSEPKSANADQSEAWNGPTGMKWVRYQDRLDTMLAPFAVGLFSAANLSHADKVLDIGCGCGVTTFEAAKLVGPAGRAHGIDLSVPMTARARERASATGSSATFDVADASARDYSADGFDHLISRFGVMFFDDPVGAFKNLHRALKPTGRMTFVCWRTMPENAWVATPLRAALPLLPPPPPPVPFAPGPFAFADDTRVTKILSDAGFSNISLTPYDTPLILGSTIEDALDQTLQIGPLARLLTEHDEATKARVADAVATELAKFLTPQGVTLAGATWIVQASA
ncbi:MAG: class I SAM-dependent methyltransferase [Parvibaculaceae bacterium]